MSPDLNKLEKMAEPLAFAFYILIAMALTLALAGFGGYAFLLLVLAGCAHAARAGLEEFVAKSRSAKVRAPRRAQARRPVRPAPSPPVEELRRVRLGG